MVIRLREQRLQSQKRKLEREVKIRTAEVVEQKEIIEKKNKHIIQNISYAKRIQNAILPANEIQKAFPDSFILNLPKEIVSGDFYWYTEITGNEENLQIIAVADCTGHGVQGAFMSMIGNDALNHVVMEREVVKPSEILKAVNERFYDMLHHASQQETRDGMDIAICVINTKEHTLEYSAARRPLFFIDGKTSSLKEIKASPLTVGRNLFSENAEFKNHTLKFSEGDKIYLFTDGYTDQFGGENNEKLMINNFKKALIALGSSSMQKQKESLETKFNQWKGTGDQLDDVLVIGIKL